MDTEKFAFGNDSKQNCFHSKTTNFGAFGMRKMLRLIWIIALANGPAGCADRPHNDPKNSIQNAPTKMQLDDFSPDPISPEDRARLQAVNYSWYKSHEDAHQWAEFAFQKLLQEEDELLKSDPQDMNQFCPAYLRADKKNRALIYVGLLDSISLLESNHNPNETYRESFKDKSGKRVLSRGLLQLSFESMQLYACGIKSADDLYDPYKNLQCGIKVLRLIVRDGVIASRFKFRKKTHWQGAASYWATLRRSKSVAKIKSNLKQTGLCGPM